MKKILILLLTGKHISILFRFYFYRLLKGKITGIENIPQSGCVFALNHGSYLDWLLIYHIFDLIYNKKIYFLGKSKLYEHPLWKIYLDYSHTIVIDYNSRESIRDSYKIMLKYLEQGGIVGIFPEGTRTHNGMLQKAQKGIANIVCKINVPIIPIGLKGFYKAWPRHKKIPGISKCEVKIGKPFYFDISKYKNKKEAKNFLVDKIMCEIAELIGEKYKYIT